MQQIVKYRRASLYRRERRWWRGAVERGVHAARVLEARLRLLKILYTVAAFIAFLCLLPGMLVVYTAIKCWRVVVRAWAVRCQGVAEVTGVTVRSAMEGQEDPGTETLLLCLQGEPSLGLLKEKIMDEIVGRVDERGQLLHPNLRRVLVQVAGYYAWRDHDAFTIHHHVTQAPHHHRGRLITSRNIQEYVSEVASEELPCDRPPWSVTLVVTSEGDGEPRSWVVGRAHHLVANQINLPDLLVTAYPDPWQLPATRNLTLLAAPAATRTFCKVARKYANALAKTGTTTARTWWEERKNEILSPIQATLEESLRAAKLNEENMTPWHLIGELLGVAVRIIGDSLAKVKLWWARMTSCLNTRTIVRAVMWAPLWVVVWWWRVVVWWVRMPVLVWAWWCALRGWVRGLRASEGWLVMTAALQEVYWMTRAFVTLPRLVLEEALSVRGVTPLMGWVGRRQRTLSLRGLGRTGGHVVAWSDPVPLSTAKGVRGATGATLSEVLLTATSGAVRDYLRVLGLPVPDEVCCTVPVYSQRWAEARGSARTPGLVTMALPTGAADASTALRIVQSNMLKIQRYPERYLASVWLLRNVSYFLPESLLGAAFRALSVRYPVLLSNLAGPTSPVTLWGHDLLNIFYWRPPQAGAVLSVCVTSYQGRAYLGVVGDVRDVPNAATLPQAFVTHLNELAVDKGVRLERQVTRSWSRSSSPGGTPTPPPTPTRPNFTPWKKPLRRQSSLF